MLENGFDHLHLEPANILVKKMPPDNPHWHIKICNIGLSQQLHPGKTSVPLKEIPGFAAPEQIKDIASDPTTTTIDPLPCDIWCLGEILFFLLTGTPPFKSVSDLQNLPQEPLTLDTVGASEPAKKFIGSLMTFDPSERPSATKAYSDPWMTTLNNNSPKLLDIWMADITPAPRVEGSAAELQPIVYEQRGQDSASTASGAWSSAESDSAVRGASRSSVEKAPESGEGENSDQCDDHQPKENNVYAENSVPSIPVTDGQAEHGDKVSPKKGPDQRKRKQKRHSKYMGSITTTIRRVFKRGKSESLIKGHTI
ncbi:kinase-like domain-containing protein [Poronia punctata]|nr:kinase-like domain-containing protein [Poronia punctata]